jgi:hypothetical protein
VVPSANATTAADAFKTSFIIFLPKNVIGNVVNQVGIVVNRCELAKVMPSKGSGNGQRRA